MSELEKAYLDWINTRDLFNRRDRPLIARDFAQIARRFGATDTAITEQRANGSGPTKKR